MKKIIALLTAVIITATIVPAFTASAADSLELPNVQNTYGFNIYKYAANTANESGSDFTEMPEIKAIGSGVTTGAKFYGTNATAVNFAEGDSLNERLADGYYFSNSDVLGAEKKFPSDATVHSSSNWFTPENGTKKMVKFTEAGSGIEFSWTEAQDVARLHLWAYPADSIKSYDIYVEVDGNMKKVLEGSLYNDIASPSNKTATFYAINLPKTYNTTKLQFVITALNGEAYITEAVPRSTVEIDLTSFNPRGVTSQSLTLTSDKSPSIYISEMILGNFNGTIRSSADETSGFYANVFDATLSPGGFFYQLNTNKKNYALGAYNWDFDSANHNAFYAVDFGEGKQTITRVTNATSNATGITEVKLYYTDDASVFASLKTSGHTSVEGWTLAGTAKRSGVNHHTNHVADFDTTVKARYWMARLEGTSASGSMYQCLGMYNRALPEEFGALTDAEIADLDMAEIEENVTAVENGTVIPKAGTNGSTITVTSDNDLVTVEEGDNWKIVTGRATVETNVNVTVAVQCGEEVRTKVYTVNLIPVPEFKNGNEGLLNDNFRLVFPEYWDLTPSGSLKTYKNWDDPKPYKRKDDRMVKFDIAGSGIEWNYDEAQTVKRLDLWVWPAYAIDDYEVQKKENGNWVTVKKDTLNPNNETLGATDGNSTSTYWNTVILDEALTASDIRFVIKSYTDSSYGAYISEADIKDNNLINLVAYNSTDNNDGQAFSIYANATKSTTASGVAESASGDKYRTWKGDITKQADGSMYYIASFPGAAHKINRIGLQVVGGTGVINKLEVLYSNDTTSMENPTDDTKWTKALDVNGKCDYTFTDNGLTIDIPDAPNAAYWMIRVVSCDDTVKIGTVRMYELAKNEISGTALSGSLNRAGLLALNIDRIENVTSGTTNVFFAAFEGKTLSYLTVVRNVELNASQNIVLYKMPSEIKETMNIKAFVITDAMLPITVPVEIIK